MREQIGQMREAMGRYAASFDASLLSCDDAAAVVLAAAAIENLAATVKGLAAARAAAGEGWKAAGDRSAAAHLARATGTSVRAAGEVLETGRRLERLPVLAAAARAGELSASQVAAVADAAVVEPSAEAALVDSARSSSLAELREHCGRAKASARPDAEARRKAVHDQRFLRAWTDAEGAWNLRMRANPEVGAVVMAAIEAVRDRLFRRARAEGRHEPIEAFAADALVELVAGAGAGAGARAKIIVRVDLPALLRGQGGVRRVLRGGRVRPHRRFRSAGPHRHRRSLPRCGGDQGPAGGGQRNPADGVGVALSHLRGRGLYVGGLAGERPPRRLGHKPHHAARPAGPALLAPP